MKPPIAFLKIFTLLIVLHLPSTLKAGFKVEFEKENVVSSRLAGNWDVHSDISTRLGRNRGGPIQFISDNSIVTRIPQKYEPFLKDCTIYMAGIFTMRGEEHPFILIQHKGNPHIVYFRTQDGDPFGDAESFNVMLAPARETQNDLLFIGGDFNNQPFTAYDRSN
jgi:hypothetical protein